MARGANWEVSGGHDKQRLSDSLNKITWSTSSLLNKARIIGYRLAMAVREIVEIEWDVLSNLETGKSFVVAIILHHAFLLC